MELNDAVRNDLLGKRVAVTGCCGTVGKELVTQLANSEAEAIIGVDQDESGLFFQGLEHRNDKRFSLKLANVRDRASLRQVFDGVDLVLHTAALKHVPLCEAAPLEAVSTNIVGTQNALEAAQESGVKRFLFTSTDKAVNPTNVMGTSKLMAERLVTACAGRSEMAVSTTRFGNVLGSNGSVMPVFHQQIAAGGPVTVTDPEMTRFVMTLSEATSLVLESTLISESGDVAITKMPVAKISDLAAVMIQELGPRYGFDPDSIDIHEIGARPGEKRYEELMNDEEVRRSVDVGSFLLVRPVGEMDDKATGLNRPDRPYNSHHEKAMDQDELREYLRSNGLFETKVQQ